MISAANVPDTLPAEVREVIDSRLGQWTSEPLRGDASTRQYLRARSEDGRTRIIAYYPPEVRSQLKRFLQAHEILSGHVPVPAILGVYEWGLIEEDLGDVSLSSLLRDDPDRARAFFTDAVDDLALIQSCGATEAPNPPFDAEFFLGEMEMTNEFYVGELMKRGDLRADLSNAFASIAKRVEAHPYVLCHRDYHGDNLQIRDDDLWLLDFQDMRFGPDTYDLASLLRDRGVVRFLGKEVERDLLRYYARRTGTGNETLSRYWEALLQRTIKIIGTFARLALERGKTHYLEFIPSALETLTDCLEQLPGYRNALARFPMNFASRRGEFS